MLKRGEEGGSAARNRHVRPDAVTLAVIPEKSKKPMTWKIRQPKGRGIFESQPGLQMLRDRLTCSVWANLAVWKRGGAFTRLDGYRSSTTAPRIVRSPSFSIHNVRLCAGSANQQPRRPEATVAGQGYVCLNPGPKYAPDGQLSSCWLRVPPWAYLPLILGMAWYVELVAEKLTSRSTSIPATSPLHPLL